MNKTCNIDFFIANIRLIGVQLMVNLDYVLFTVILRISHSTQHILEWKLILNTAIIWYITHIDLSIKHNGQHIPR